MPIIKLPDGISREYDTTVSGIEIAESIGPSLAKAALLVEVNGDLCDLSLPISEDAEIRIITEKDEEALEVIRHDSAHILAEAVKELWPETQVTIGPAIDNGFYYDFARETPFSIEDLELIEKRMLDIVSRNEKIEREVWSRNDATEFFSQAGEHYKAEIISGLPEEEPITIYRQGKFVDLCRGPHLPSTGRVGAFKLLKVAGAYWRGDSQNEMLQRIYGTAWSTKKELDLYLQRLEEAEKRDHRRLGRQMDLFHFQEESPGAVFWHPKGWRLFRSLVDYMRERQELAGYVEINTPEIMDRSMWEASGHWQTFRQHMFTTQTEDSRIFAIKPMNCPGGVQVFRNNLRSYRELPMRIAEFGKVHRYEPSGSLHGLMRVRAFTQDDAHIFCTESQVQDECCSVVELILSIYKDFGFADVKIKFADRPEVRIGSDETWDKLESALRGALDSMGYKYEVNPGEGAFYGPKIEFVLTDAIGREWQCGTLQVDLNLPERLDANYIGIDGEKHRPVMLHRALFGSLERFTGILIEHYSGNLPLWLSPLQVVVASITNEIDDYARQVLDSLRSKGLKAELDIRNEKIGYKIREHSIAKVPIIVALGAREVENNTVAIRRLGSKNQEILDLNEAISILSTESKDPLAGQK
tara:strand:- start:25467 stop:27389 length:1923 start_codon:yes stop_codon:yes gene_type:complete